MPRYRRPGQIIRVSDPSEVRAAFTSAVSGVLVSIPMTDTVAAELAALTPAQAMRYKHSLSGRTESLPALHKIFANTSAYLRDIVAVYEEISAPDHAGITARGSPQTYVGSSLVATWHFDASRRPFALAKPGHIHLAGGGMGLLSVEGAYDLPLYDPESDASQSIRQDDIAALCRAAGIRTKFIKMGQSDLLIFDETCLHISSTDPGEASLKLRASLTMNRIQASAVTTAPSANNLN